MDGQQPKRQRFRWSIGATVIALALWAILSLSQTYTWDVSVPLWPNIDTTRQTLAEPIPRSLDVSLRGDGWTLLQVRLFRDLICRVRPSGPPTSSDDTSRMYMISESDLVRSISTPSSVSVESVRPSSLRLALTSIARKQVPLRYPDVSIGAREGFQVIGRVDVMPDSVELRGPGSVLDNIDQWHTKPLDVTDVYQKIDVSVPVNDSLFGVVSIQPSTATVSADVQEVAELQYDNLRITNRETVTDTTLQLQLYPNTVSVTVRGGAGELADLSEGDVVPYINCAPSVDTTGVAIVRISLPRKSNARVVSISPKRTRYVWRRVVTDGTGPPLARK